MLVSTASISCREEDPGGLEQERSEASTPDRNARMLAALNVVHEVATSTPTELRDSNPGLNLLDAYLDGNRACGVLADTARKVAAEAQLKTRGVNIYGLPQQGNHVLLEVQLDIDEWMLIDPTFGVLWTSPDGQETMSLEQVRGLADGDAVDFACVRIRNSGTPEEAPIPLDRRFTPGFGNPPFMTAENYLLASTSGSWSTDQRLSLPWPFEAEETRLGIDPPGLDSTESRSSEFLTWTNTRITDGTLANDVSFLASRVGRFSRGNYTPTIHLPRIERGVKAELRIFAERTRGTGRLVLVPLNGSASIPHLEAETSRGEPAGNTGIWTWRLYGTDSSPLLLVEPEDDITRFQIYSIEILNNTKDPSFAE
ncbi:MAG: hypothetical protein GY911_01050 [Actinomycetales bacterium]|nr:hypothetical protein [Actinomycetales bacterium]